MEKRKTTSTAVKQRYNDKTYTQFRAPLRNEDYAEIDAFIRSNGWSKAEFVKRAYQLFNPCRPSVQCEFSPKILMFFYGSAEIAPHHHEDLPYIRRAYDPRYIDTAKNDAVNLVNIYSRLDYPTNCCAIVMQAECSSTPFGDPEFIKPFIDESGAKWYYSGSVELFRFSNETKNIK